MNASIANLLLSRIEAADLGFVDKTAGLTRAITDGRLESPTVFPVACTVNDPLACDSNTLADLLPDPRYRSVMFFEAESGPRRIQDRIRGTRYEVTLRLIAWLNCEKLGGGCDCGDIAEMELVSLLNARVPDEFPFNHVRHTVVGGGPTRGKDIFGRYTFDEKRTQYLHYPYSFFALDIVTAFHLQPGCTPESIADNVACWASPENPRRRYPREFTFDELNDPTNGLTVEQRAAICS